MLKRGYVQVSGGRPCNNEGDHGRRFRILFEPLVQPVEGFDKYIHTLVAVLVAPAGEYIEGAVEIERVARKKVTHYEFVNALLVFKVQILKFMQSGESVGIQSVRNEKVRFTSEEMPGLLRRDAAYRSKEGRIVRGRAFDQKS